MAFALYELAGKYRDLLDLVDEVEGGDQAFADTLEMLEDDINEKVDNIGKLIKSIEAESNALDEEKKRIEARIQSRKNKVARLKEYLKENLEGLENPKVKTPLFTAWVQNNPCSVDIVDEASIPKTYFIEQKPKLDRKTIIDALKNGETIEGAVLTQSKGIRIR